MEADIGAPLDKAAYRYGSAGSVESGCRVDCWLQASGGRLTSVRFEVFAGCATIQAAAWLAAWLEGRSVTNALSVTGLWLAEQTRLAAEQRGDALCIEDALRAALGEDV